MRRKIGLLIVLAYVAIIAAAILSIGCSDGSPPVAADNTPNLLAEGLVFSAERAPAGGEIEMTRTLRNDGTTDAGEFVVEYYLSTDAELDTAGDALVATEVVAGLAAGDEDTRPVTLACGDLAGDFHCIASIDPADAVHEIDEEDNLAATAATLMVCTPPNLKAEGTSLFSPSPAARPGAALEAMAAILETEAGLDVEVAFDVTAYLSPDRTVDPEADLPLVVAAAGPLAAGGGELVPLVLTLPELTPPGRWYVGSHVDSSGLVAETDESDNVDAPGTLALVDVLPPALAPGEADLMVHDSRAALPWNGSAYELASGSSFLFLVDVLCMGEPPAGDLRIGVYFSEDDALTTGDTLVGSATLTAAEAARGAVPIECRAPEAPAGSTFRWGAIVDDLGAVAEADETNNAHVNWDLEIVSAPTVDLVAAFINDGPPIMALEAGRPRLVNFWLASAGSTESGFFTVKLYASPDAEITGSGNDIEIGYKWFRYLPAGYSSAEMGGPEWATVEVPVGTPL
ncbi:MAG: CARDB domain-containing protein, partial [Planctomycetota bacterium]